MQAGPRSVGTADGEGQASAGAVLGLSTRWHSEILCFSFLTCISQVLLFWLLSGSSSKCLIMTHMAVWAFGETYV